jgi:hypothetical protein
MLALIARWGHNTLLVGLGALQIAIVILAK